MNNLVFASANNNKVTEVFRKLGGKFPLQGLTDIGCADEIPETSPTLEGNARQKARFIFEKYHVDCFADDTGLEVLELNNHPGVMSARYAGDQRNADDNIKLLLSNLEGYENRMARFRTVICLILQKQEYFFEGVVEGRILEAPRGKEGFGYDSIFMPDGELRTFAEMTMDEKNALSHRGRAIEKLEAFLSAWS